MDQQDTKTTSHTCGKPAEIITGLWIGSIASLRALNEDDTRWTVISVMGAEKMFSLANSFLQPKKAKQQCNHILLRIADKNDSEMMNEKLKSILQIIDNTVAKQDTKEACLVHCAMGVSRSAAVCVAWLMSRKKMSLQQAMETIRKVRPQAMPNMGFIASLRALEACEGDIDKAIKRLGSKGVEI